MRDVVQELLSGIPGQSLILDAPEGRPSSVISVTVLLSESDDNGATEPATTGTASISAISTTLAAAAGPTEEDPTALELTDVVTPAMGDPLVLTDSDGEIEWIDLVSLIGTSAHSRVPLINEYVAGATLTSPRISIALDATWVMDDSKLSDECRTNARYRAVWVYVVDGITRRRATAFDVVRYTSSHHVTPLDVDIAYPGWLDRIPVDYRSEQGRPLIEQAWREVRTDLLADGKLGRWLRDADVVSQLVLTRANQKALEVAALHGGATVEQLTIAQNLYRARFDQLIREPHTPAGMSAMGATVPARRAPLWRR